MGERHHKKNRNGNPDNRTILRFDKRAATELEAMRDTVENIAKGHLSNIYKLEPGQMMTTKIDGVEYGYKVEDHTGGMLAIQPFYLRKIFIKFHGYKVDEIPKKQLQPFLVSVFESMLDRGEGPPNVNKIAPDCILITQRFMPDLLTKVGGLVSIAGRA